MSTNEAKPTPGPVELWPTVPEKHLCRVVCHLCGFWSVVAKDPIPRHTAEEYGQFIADAFNTYHETGLTPRELVEQREELFECVQSAINLLKGLDEGHFTRLALTRIVQQLRLAEKQQQPMTEGIIK